MLLINKQKIEKEGRMYKNQKCLFQILVSMILLKKKNMNAGHIALHPAISSTIIYPIEI